MTRTGVLLNARTAIEAWYLGGERVELMEDGSFVIYNGYFTTCESSDAEWQIRSNKITVNQDQTLFAQNISFRFIKLPLFWFPSYRGSLKSFFDAPITYRFSVGGRQQLYASMRYRIWARETNLAYLRLDYRLRRGPGVGFETEYVSEDKRTRAYTRSYIANDGSLFDDEQDTRYRLEGLYESTWKDGEYDVLARYDKMSDEDVPTDYQQKDFNLRSAGRTELKVHRQDESWTGNLFTRVRINDFQTVRQELPSFQGSIRPFTLGNTGIVTDPRGRVGYFDFRFADDIPMASPYNAVRAEMRPRFYRPFALGPSTFTPELELVGIYYSNSPGSGDQWLGTAKLMASWNTHFHKTSQRTKQVLTPYAEYQHWTTPSSSPNSHYIFGLDDGWTTLNQLEFGIQHSVFMRNRHDQAVSRLTGKLYAYAFFDTPTIGRTIPWILGEVSWEPYDTTRYFAQMAFDFRRNEIHFANARTEWTLSKDLALAAELRYRGSYDWRKVKRDHFLLDSQLSEGVLIASPLSDRRNTLLYDLHYRMNHQWQFHAQGRHGWNRRTEPGYNEFEFSLITMLRCAWQLRMSYQHREHDQRFSVFLTLQEKAPKIYTFEDFTSPL